jgi:hypothetical protein
MTSKPTVGLTRQPVQWVPGGVSPAVKRQKREADHAPPSMAKVNGGAIPPLPHTSSRRSAYLFKPKNNFPFLRFTLGSFFLSFWDGVRLSPLATSATVRLLVPAPDDRRWVWSSRWNENWQGKPKYSEKTCSSATLSTTNPTLPDLGSNPSRRGGKSSTNRLSYGTVLPWVWWHVCPWKSEEPSVWLILWRYSVRISAIK